jgi:major membrane immunogen (membrane-anchored lipoprotein)
MIAYRNASRQVKLRNEIAQEKRENAAFVQNVERGKMIEHMQSKKAKKGELTEEDNKPRRHFRQKSVITPQSNQSTNILNKVFE